MYIILLKLANKKDIPRLQNNPDVICLSVKDAGNIKHFLVENF